MGYSSRFKFIAVPPGPLSALTSRTACTSCFAGPRSSSRFRRTLFFHPYQFKQKVSVVGLLEVDKRFMLFCVLLRNETPVRDDGDFISRLARIVCMTSVPMTEGTMSTSCIWPTLPASYLFTGDGCPNSPNTSTSLQVRTGEATFCTLRYSEFFWTFFYYGKFS